MYVKNIKSSHPPEEDTDNDTDDDSDNEDEDDGMSDNSDDDIMTEQPSKKQRIQ